MMASSVSADLLKRLSVAAQGLNNVSDIFNDQIKIIEEALASYNLGVRAYVDAATECETYFGTDGQPCGVDERKIMVGYEKWNGKWCLMVHTYLADEEFPNGFQQWPLRDAPRERRLQAVDGIPKLLEKLIEEAETLAREVGKKTAATRVLAASIKPKEGQ